MNEVIQASRVNVDIRSISAPLYESRIWLKILGISSIAGGVFAALTIVGIVFAWIPIWLGVASMRAAKAVTGAFESGSAEALQETNIRLRTAITIMGVLQLIMLILYAVSFIFGFFGMFAMDQMGTMGMQ